MELNDGERERDSIIGITRRRCRIGRVNVALYTIMSTDRHE